MQEKINTKQPVRALYIYLTNRCNLKCLHCYYYPVHDTESKVCEDEVSYDLLCSAIDELIPLGLETCKLSGGEPFIRKDALDICRYIGSKDLRLQIETNGTFLTPYHAETLAEVNNVFISVSLDGANEETHEKFRRVRGCFHDAVRGLEYLIEADLATQVITTLSEENKEEMISLMDICASKGVKSIKMNLIAPIGRGKELQRVDYNEVLEIDNQLSEYAASVGIGYHSPLPVGIQRVTNIIRHKSLCSRCSINSTLGILSDGTISICGMGRHIEDFRFGKLGEDSIAKVWMTHPVLKLIRARIPDQLQGICGRCIARNSCLGYCRINTEDITVDTLLEPYPVCDKMEKQKSFPKTRIIDDSKADLKKYSIARG